VGKVFFLPTIPRLVGSKKTLPTLASPNCNYATRLVIQAYDWGDAGRKDMEKQLLEQALQFMLVNCSG